MPIGWIISNVALWIVVIFETVLLLLLLRVLGEMRQNRHVPSSNDPLNDGIPVGEQAPDFDAKDQQGRVVNLRNFQGRWRILAFVSPGCKACKETIGVLNDTQRNRQQLTVLLVGEQDFQQNQEYAHEHKAQMPILTPAHNLARNIYRIQGVPFVFILDENGIIRAKGIVNEPDHMQELLKRAFDTVLLPM